MTAPDCPTLTAAEIGAALGKSRFAVRRALAQCAPSGFKKAKNNMASAWRVNDLPAALREQLEKRGTRHAFTAPAEALQTAGSAWQPAIPLAQCAPADVEAAQKLQRALDVCLALPAGASLAERVSCARPLYRREVGHDVGERHLARLITRTLDRDGNVRNFARLEIYLPDAPRVRRAATARTIIGAELFAPIDEAFATLDDRNNPTIDEKDFCWKVAIEWLAERVESGVAEGTAKAELRGFIMRQASFMGRTENAVRVAIDRKLAAVAEQGITAIYDQRREKSGKRGEVPEWEENIDLLKKWMLARHGRVAQAWRELYEEAQHPHGWRFTKAFRDYYRFDVRRDKSAVPRRVMYEMRPAFAAVKDEQKGPRARNLLKPSNHLDWSKELPGAFHCADDATPDLRWVDFHEFGEYEYRGERFDVGRGQWLPMLCAATDFPLGSWLTSTPTYSGVDVQTLCQKTWMDETIGLPSQGCMFEMGVWKSLRVKRLFSWAMIDKAFGKAGINLRLRTVTTPQAKPVENAIGRWHRRLDHLPGWVGNNERKGFERVENFISRLKRVGQPRKSEVNPRELLLDREQLADEIAKMLVRFSNEVQNGDRLPGISPAEAWRQRRPANHTVKVLPESLRYLLSTDRSDQDVTHQGVRVRVGGLWHYYFGSERLGELRGEPVEVYYNPALPSHVTVIHRRSDPRGERAFSVPLAPRILPHDATSEDFAAHRSAQKAFAKFGRGTFRRIVPPSNITIRQESLGPDVLRTTGEAINRAERETIDLGNRRTRTGRQAVQVAARYGIRLDPAKMKDPDAVCAKAQRLAELRARAEQAEAAQPQPASGGATATQTAAKTYTLQSARPEAIGKPQIGAYWATWSAAEKAQPGIDRHAITRRVLGYNKPHRQLTVIEWGKIISAFSEIAKSAKP